MYTLLPAALAQIGSDSTLNPEPASNLNLNKSCLNYEPQKQTQKPKL